MSFLVFGVKGASDANLLPAIKPKNKMHKVETETLHVTLDIKNVKKRKKHPSKRTEGREGKKKKKKTPSAPPPPPRGTDPLETRGLRRGRRTRAQDMPVWAAVYVYVPKR
jgi:hypothetical protein